MRCPLGLTSAGIVSAIALLPALAPTHAREVQTPCAPVVHAGQTHIVCRFHAAIDHIALYHRDTDGAIYRTFERLEASLSASGRTLVFAMNAGMYHADRSPVGLLTINGEEIAPLNRSTWVGNFYLKPNGVFFVRADGTAGVMETERFRTSGIAPRHATQSGPMLVIDGALHPRFLVDASSRNIRNGVGVSVDGQQIVFAISAGPVTFHEFGTLFRDVLKTPNALYLDGSISRLFARDLNRNDPGEDMGPIVAVSVPTGQ